MPVTDQIEARAPTLADVPEPEWTRIGTGLAPLDELLGGGFVTPSTVLLWGSRGSGKTTLAFLACASLRTTLVPLEMSASLYRHTATRAGARLERVRVAPADTTPTDWISFYRRTHSEALIVDSLGKVADPTATLQALHDATNSGRVGLVLAIAHATRDGDARGGPALEHEADVCLMLEPGRASVLKSRFGPTGETPLAWPPG